MMQFEYFNARLLQNTALKIKETVGAVTPPAGYAFGVLSALTNLEITNSDLVENVNSVYVNTLDIKIPTEETMVEYVEYVFEHDAAKRDSVIIKSNTIPAASAELLGYEYQYMGETNNTYTHGFVYVCKGIPTDTLVFTPDTVSCDWADLSAFLQTETADYNSVVAGSMTYFADAELWRATFTDANGDTVLTYQQYTGDWENVGFVFSGTFEDGDVVSFVRNTEFDYVWERVDLQPNHEQDIIEIREEIEDLKGLGRFLSVWNCVTGLAETNPPESPYTYHTGDYFLVGTVGTTNYRPNGSTYTTGVPSTTVETEVVKVNDVYIYDGTNWKLQANSQRDVTFGGIVGNPYDNTALATALNEKQNTISDLATIRSYAQAGKAASDTIATYGDVVTHDASEFASSTSRINGAPLSNAVSNFFGVSDTAAATVQKEVSIPSITTLDVGTAIIVKPTVTSTVASSTLKLNNFDAYPMRYNGGAISTSTDSIVWAANVPSWWVFDGTYWVFSGHGLDSNTTYTLNYSVDAGQYTAGSGTYAVTRYSILAQKADGTWEKITATNANYSAGTSKSVNTSGFILNQLRYYGTTTAVAGGVKIATNVMYEKSASVDMRYSTNCGGTTTWALGDYIYLVGTIGADGLFYLDTTTWWSNALPTTNDGKLYIRLGLSLTAAGYTMSFFDDRPIFYHDGTGIKEYKVADNKQDVISDLATIRSGAGAGATAVQPGDLATVATTGDYDDLLNKPTIPAAQVNSDWNANSGVAQILNKPTLATVATSGSYNDLSNKPTIPTVNNPTITITQGGITKGSFTLNQATGDTIGLDAGGGGIGNIDNLTITANADDEIQAVAVIDQNTGIAKTWTGTMAEYEAIVTKDPETEYIITDDIGGSATEIGEITEALNNKVDKGHQVVEFQEPTAANNYTWYRKYADGWVEQGSSLGYGNTTVNLPITMLGVDYTITLALISSENNNNTFGYRVYQIASTNFTVRTVFSGTQYNYRFAWQVSGMAA